jgi:hypothetical protein
MSAREMDQGGGQMSSSCGPSPQIPFAQAAIELWTLNSA